MIKVRFAPSPTGNLHIGGARTCLFSWLFARKNNGTFILRIEDTDLERSKPEYLKEILDSIGWLGMNWDEIHYQSKRFDLYRQYAQKLIDEGKAAARDGAIFFKYHIVSEITINDLIRGPIVFNELPKEEEVIIKSDGSPTYNFSCAIDDALMGINYVIRGEDHISNTPKQILMYQALGFPVPDFAHVPLILSPDGGRMSKRYGATAISEYRKMGYLPDAIVNYLLLLGWSPGENRELISLNEAIQLFEVKHVNKTGAAFSLDKLNWVNGAYIRAKTVPQLAKLIKEFAPSLDSGGQYLEKVAGLFKERMVTLAEFVEKSKFCFSDEFTYSDEAKQKLEKDHTKEISAVIAKFSSLPDFTAHTIELEFRQVCQDTGLKVRDLVHPVRGALSGVTAGPGLFEMIEVLGKPKVLARLQRLLDYWKSR